MMKRFLLIATTTATLWAQEPAGPGVPGVQGRGTPPNREASVTSVPFERILHANQEPQNWLTYSGNYNGQRHSTLSQISPENARDLTLKWVYQSHSLDKHERSEEHTSELQSHSFISYAVF